jgi:hypothetical protein
VKYRSTSLRFSRRAVLAVHESRYQARCLQASYSVEARLPESWPTNELRRASSRLMRGITPSNRVDLEDFSAFVKPADRKGNASRDVIVLPGVTLAPILMERPDNLPWRNRWVIRGRFRPSVLCGGTVPTWNRVWWPTSANSSEQNGCDAEQGMSSGTGVWNV